MKFCPITLWSGASMQGHLVITGRPLTWTYACSSVASVTLVIWHLWLRTIVIQFRVTVMGLVSRERPDLLIIFLALPLGRNLKVRKTLSSKWDIHFVTSVGQRRNLSPVEGIERCRWRAPFHGRPKVGSGYFCLGYFSLVTKQSQHCDRWLKNLPGT